MPTKKKLVEPTYDTQLSLLGDGTNIYMKIAWPVGDTEQISEFLLSVATGSAFGIFMQNAEEYSKSIGDEENFEKMVVYITNTLMNQKNEVKNQNNRLVVEPINAIAHLATLHQGHSE